jgi:hypothetical protein
MQVLANPHAPRTAAGDVYAYAIVLLELMTGRACFRNMRAADVRRAVIEGRRPPVPGWMPARITQIVTACWAQVCDARMWVWFTTRTVTGGVACHDVATMSLPAEHLWELMLRTRWAYSLPPELSFEHDLGQLVAMGGWELIHSRCKFLAWISFLPTVIRHCSVSTMKLGRAL